MLSPRRKHACHHLSSTVTTLNMALTRLDAGLGGAERFLEELEKKRKVLDQCLQARGIVHALGLPTAHCALLLALLTSPSPSRRTQPMDEDADESEAPKDKKKSWEMVPTRASNPWAADLR